MEISEQMIATATKGIRLDWAGVNHNTVTLTEKIMQEYNVSCTLAAQAVWSAIARKRAELGWPW